MQNTFASPSNDCKIQRNAVVKDNSLTLIFHGVRLTAGFGRIMRIQRIENSTLAVVVLLVSHVAEYHHSIHADEQAQIAAQCNAERFAVIGGSLFMRITKSSVLGNCS